MKRSLFRFFAMAVLAGAVAGTLAAYGSHIQKLTLERYLDMESVSNPQISPDGSRIATAGFALAVLAAVTFAAWRLRERAPQIGVGWLWFLGTLVPVIGVVQATPGRTSRIRSATRSSPITIEAEVQP